MDSLYALKEKTGKDSVDFTNRCNTSIKYAMNLCIKLNDLNINEEEKRTVVVQKEGGWLTYDKIATRLGLNVVYVNTIDSKVDLKDLEKILKNNDDVLAFIYNRLPGYFCHNDNKEIIEMCFEYDVFTIEDQSGELYPSRSDFIVGSFGRWKPLNLGHGGFIAHSLTFEDQETNPFVIPCDHPNLRLEIKPYITNYDQRVRMLKEITRKIKIEFEEFNIIRKEDDGINVIVAYDSEDEKKKIIQKCIDNKLEYEECPRDIRINRNAISIEIKRIETHK